MKNIKCLKVVLLYSKKTVCPVLCVLHPIILLALRQELSD